MGEQPTRIQLKRTKGWRMPPNTVKVDRTTRWGNPFKVGEMWTRRRMTPGGGEKSCGPVKDNAEAVRLFRRFTARETAFQIMVEQLRGKNLACWCKPGDPCHADVLLELANRDL